MFVVSVYIGATVLGSPVWLFIIFLNLILSELSLAKDAQMWAPLQSISFNCQTAASHITSQSHSFPTSGSELSGLFTLSLKLHEWIQMPYIHPLSKTWDHMICFPSEIPEPPPLLSLFLGDATSKDSKLISSLRRLLVILKCQLLGF